MSVPQQGAEAQTSAPTGTQSRTLAGTLGKTPIPRLLMSASTARVTGTLELTSGEGEAAEQATVIFVRGMVTKVKTNARVASLGAVLYELGYIDTEVLNDSLRELARMQWLHGEILLTRGIITQVQLVEGLAEQTTRKLAHLFTLPATTTYSFEAEVDRLTGWGGGDWPHVDPAIAVWRGVRDGLAEEDIAAAFERLQKSAFRIVPGADPKRFDLAQVELGAVACLRARALTLDELAGLASVNPKRARELLYFLMVTKQAESVDVSGIRPAYRPSADSSPYTKPTVPEMPAVGSAPRMAVSRPQTESARWRAVAPIPRHESTKVARMEVQPAESAKMPVAGRSAASTVPPQVTSSIPPQVTSSAPARITIGGVEPNGAGAPRRPTPMPTHQSTGQFNARVVAELVSRRQSIFERARAILKEDHFQRMSLPKDARTEQVEAAFVALKTLWDPELLPSALEEAKNDCAFVLSCLVEAHAVLRDDATRAAYAKSLTVLTLRPQQERLDEDLAASGATELYDGALNCLAQGDLDRAERLARGAMRARPDAGAPIALLAWIEATRPANMSPEETKKRIVMLDRAVRIDPTLEQAYYWRGLLHKRIDSHSAAMGNFRRVVELNPRHLDAVRELRVYDMRIRRNSITMKGVK